MLAHPDFLKALRKTHFLPAFSTIKSFVSGADPVTNYLNNKRYDETLSKLKDSDKWTREDVKDFQLKNIQKLIKHAYDNVHYYNRVFKEQNIHPEDIKSFEDFARIPILDKDIVKANFNDLIAMDVKKSDIKLSSTSGSTGHPFEFMVDKKYSTIIEKAFIANLWGRAGYNKRSSMAALTGNILPKAGQGIFWKYDNRQNHLVLSSFHIFENTYREYIRVINEKNIEFIRAYPSAICLLAKYLGTTSAKPIPTLKGIFCASETLHDWQRKLLQETFKCQVFSHYGHAEKCVLAGECEVSSKYHIQPEYGYLELMNSDGNIIKDENDTGEIIATSFTNYVMPLIRYRTLDMASFSFSKCICGRNYDMLNSVEGRALEYFIGREGNLITSTGGGLIIKRTPNILKLQYRQNVKGEVVLLIAPSKNYNSEDESLINQYLKEKYQDNLKFTVELVDDIPPLANGKYKYVVQNLDIDYVLYNNRA